MRQHCTIFLAHVAGYYAVLMGGSNGDGARRGLVTIVELIDPRPYIFQSAVYGRLIYTVISMSDRLLTQANPDPRLPPNCVVRVDSSLHRSALCTSS